LVTPKGDYGLLVKGFRTAAAKKATFPLDLLAKIIERDLVDAYVAEATFILSFCGVRCSSVSWE